jgi:hypothetical protein
LPPRACRFRIVPACIWLIPIALAPLAVCLGCWLCRAAWAATGFKAPLIWLARSKSIRRGWSAPLVLAAPASRCRGALTPLVLFAARRVRVSWPLAPLIVATAHRGSGSLSPLIVTTPSTKGWRWRLAPLVLFTAHRASIWRLAPLVLLAAHRGCRWLAPLIVILPTRSALASGPRPPFVLTWPWPHLALAALIHIPTCPGHFRWHPFICANPLAAAPGGWLTLRLPLLRALIGLAPARLRITFRWPAPATHRGAATFRASAALFPGHLFLRILASSARIAGNAAWRRFPGPRILIGLLGHVALLPTTTQDHNQHDQDSNDHNSSSA